MTRAHGFAAVGAAALLLSTVTPATALPRERGFEVGLRTGYALPLGKGGADATAQLSELIPGAIPIWVDLGYRITPNFMVGMNFVYGFGLNGDLLKNSCDANGSDCGVHDVRLGIQAQYHFLPQETTDPWLGIGAGYEWLTVSESVGGRSGSLTVSGLEFVNLQAGVDFEPSEDANFGIGPFVALSVAQYSDASCSGLGGCLSSDFETSLHEWLTLGLRGTFVP